MPIPPQTLPRRGIAAAGAPGPGLQMLQGALLIVAVLYFARELLIPLVLAVLLAFVLAPVTRVLRRVGLPRAGAVLAAVLIGGTVVAGIGLLMGRQATLLAGNLPSYQQAIGAKLGGLQASGGVLDRVSETLKDLGRAPHPAPAPPPGDGGAAAVPRPAPAAAGAGAGGQPARPLPVEIREPEPTALETLRRVAEPLLHPLATTGIVLILVIFVLLYREDLRDRLIRLAGARDLHRTMAAMDDAAYRLSRYFLAQVALNAGFGLFVTGMLWLIGIPNPLLWGFVAGLMRFVPFIGAFVAVAGPALLALAVDPGWGTLAMVLAVFAVSEVVMGQVFEPWIFGHSTGLSPVAVIAAATFWTWLWGPIGLLLAVPLTVCLVVLGRHVDRLEFLEVMLGDRPALDPEETFYQRALAGDADALAEQSERLVRERGLDGYLDAVALPALRLAQADAAREALAPERLERLAASVRTLLEDLEAPAERRTAAEDAAAEGAAAAPPPPPPEWQAAGAVLCVPGRGPVDPLLAEVLARALAARGFGAQAAAGTGAGAAAGAPPRLVCLCMLEGGASAATARYLLRRTRRRLPGVPALALAWRPEELAEEGAALAQGLRAEAAAAGGGGPPLLAATVREAVELAADTAGVAAPPAAAPAEPVAPSPAQQRPPPEPPPTPAARPASDPAPVATAAATA